VIGAVITAIGVIAAAFIGGAYAGPRIGLVIAQPTVTVTAPAAHTATPQASNSGGSGTQASAGQLLFHKDNVQLTSGNALSFTDPTLRPFSNGCSGADLYICSSFYVGSSAQLADYNGRAGFSQCQADTTYVSGNNIFQSLVGHTLCVTTADRIAACYVIKDTTQQSVPAPGINMDCTVYALK
jgi:hypothetical protein